MHSCIRGGVVAVKGASASGPDARNATSGSRHRAAIDRVLGPGDGRRPRRDQECNQIGYLGGLGRAPQRNAAQSLHDLLFGTLII